MSNLLWIFIVALFAFLFFQQRKQTELAQQFVEQRCNTMGLQLLSVARGSHKLKDHNDEWGWRTLYHFEFSTNGIDHYQGFIEMKRFRASYFYLPPHHMPEMDSSFKP
ncbi:TPA: DUF3301 domain-containing protein [Photobacterium damselae]